MRSNIKGQWQPGHQCESFHWSIIYTVAHHASQADNAKPTDTSCPGRHILNCPSLPRIRLKCRRRRYLDTCAKCRWLDGRPSASWHSSTINFKCHQRSQIIEDIVKRSCQADKLVSKYTQLKSWHTNDPASLGVKPRPQAMSVTVVRHHWDNTMWAQAMSGTAVSHHLDHTWVEPRPC